LKRPHLPNIGGDIWLDGGWFVVRLGVGGLATCKNAIAFDHHGGRCRHTVAMGPHSRQQIIQQSTNMLCGRSTSLKLENNVFITSDITINARRVDDNNARTIASLASSPPVVSGVAITAATMAPCVCACPPVSRGNVSITRYQSLNLTPR